MNIPNLNARARETVTKTGLERNDRLDLAEQLGSVLANTYSLYVKTQGVHWNIVGPMFYSVHKLTEEQYVDLAKSIDEIAERIRALGFKAPAGLGKLQSLSYLESDIDYDSAVQMLQTLVSDNETLSRNIREVVKLAEHHDDVKTADLLTERIGRLEENAWMLRSLIAS